MDKSYFSILDVIGDQLEKNKDRLGPFYRPLYLLSGALAFVLLFAAMVGLPVIFFKDFSYIVFAQIFLIAVYFMLLLTIPQNVFDRFAFCALLFVVLSAAPVLIGGQAFLAMLTASKPDFFGTVIELPKREFYFYGLLRGVGNTSWALPILFYFYTFFPRLKDKPKEGAGRAFSGSLWMALALQTVCSAMIVWQDAVVQRFIASAEGASPGVRQAIESSQWGYLIFSVLYLAIGFVAIAVIKRWSAADDRRVIWMTVAGLAAVQLCYSLAAYNVRQLNLRYPAARTTGGSIEAFASKESGEIVFTNPTFRNISKEKLGRWQPYSLCRDPKSREFTYVIEEASKFGELFEKRDLMTLKISSPEDLFCQPDGG